MQKWAKRLSGPTISILLFLHGVPGFIDDSVTWAAWVKQMSIPLILYPVGICAGILWGTSEWWWPWILRLLKKDRRMPTTPSLNAWRAPDGSITLKQAAFLWVDMPMQEPTPPEVQDRIAIFKNAIEQGALHRHKRHDEATEKNIAFLRLLVGNPTPIDTRVMPSELRRWAGTIGDTPDFLLNDDQAINS